MSSTPVRIRPREISAIESYYLSHKDVAGLFGTGGTDTYACG